MTHIQTIKEFEDLIENNKNVVIDFYATWCGPCKMLAPIFEEVAKERTDVAFVKVDVDQAGELSAKFNIMSIPTVLYIKDKEVLHKELGFRPKDAIIDNINKLF